jgi:hypothetical protein
MTKWLAIVLDSLDSTCSNNFEFPASSSISAANGSQARDAHEPNRCNQNEKRSHRALYMTVSSNLWFLIFLSLLATTFAGHTCIHDDATLQNGHELATVQQDYQMGPFTRNSPLFSNADTYVSLY